MIGLSARTAQTRQMDDLFGASNAEEIGVDPGAPLAARMRPRSLEEYQGQPHILGPGKLLRRAIESDRLIFDHFLRATRQRKDQLGPDHRLHDKKSF